MYSFRSQHGMLHPSATGICRCNGGSDNFPDIGAQSLCTSKGVILIPICHPPSFSISVWSVFKPGGDLSFNRYGISPRGYLPDIITLPSAENNLSRAAVILLRAPSKAYHGKDKSRNRLSRSVLCRPTSNCLRCAKQNKNRNCRYQATDGLSI